MPGLHYMPGFQQGAHMYRRGSGPVSSATPLDAILHGEPSSAVYSMGAPYPVGAPSVGYSVGAPSVGYSVGAASPVYSVGAFFARQATSAFYQQRRRSAPDVYTFSPPFSPRRLSGFPLSPTAKYFLHLRRSPVEEYPDDLSPTPGIHPSNHPGNHPCLSPALAKSAGSMSPLAGHHLVPDGSPSPSFPFQMPHLGAISTSPISSTSTLPTETHSVAIDGTNAYRMAGGLESDGGAAEADELDLLASSSSDAGYGVGALGALDAQGVQGDASMEQDQEQERVYCAEGQMDSTLDTEFSSRDLSPILDVESDVEEQEMLETLRMQQCNHRTEMLGMDEELYEDVDGHIRQVLPFELTGRTVVPDPSREVLLVDHGREMLPCLPAREVLPLVPAGEALPLVPTRESLPLVPARDALPLVSGGEQPPFDASRGVLQFVSDREVLLLDPDREEVLLERIRRGEVIRGQSLELEHPETSTSARLKRTTSFDNATALSRMLSPMSDAQVSQVPFESGEMESNGEDWEGTGMERGTGQWEVTRRDGGAGQWEVTRRDGGPGQWEVIRREGGTGQWAGMGTEPSTAAPQAHTESNSTQATCQMDHPGTLTHTRQFGAPQGDSSQIISEHVPKTPTESSSQSSLLSRGSSGRRKLPVAPPPEFPLPPQLIDIQVLAFLYR